MSDTSTVLNVNTNTKVDVTLMENQSNNLGFQDDANHTSSTELNMNTNIKSEVMNTNIRPEVISIGNDVVLAIQDDANQAVEDVSDNEEDGRSDRTMTSDTDSKYICLSLIKPLN